MRGLCYEVAADLDRASKLEDREERERAQSLLDLMIPVVKAWCTDIGLAITSTNIQVHGGMGFMEETGAEDIIEMQELRQSMRVQTGFKPWICLAAK